ncbi:MAG TPA: AarF/UbiB family protein [Pirellulales bacterium]|nr:AarF/UbiB family protein [Pirellulales bacterium]
MLSLKPAYLSRYAAIAKILLKYGRSDLVNHPEIDALAVSDSSAVDQDSPTSPECFAKDLEAMGPTFIKLGQLLSTRADFLPPAYLEALERLQDHVEPLPFETIEAIIEEELGVRLSKAFADFEPTAIATASIGQVHRARLRDGRRVAVKVQRPNLHRQVEDDLAAMHQLGELLDEHTDIGRRIRFVQIVESLREVMRRELDYRQEAENGHTLQRNLAQFDRFVIPTVIDDYTSGRVITQEYIEGAKITNLSPVVLVELDRKQLADELFNVYLHQVLVDGVFHADPHPGNLMLTPDRRIALMDFGMVSRVAPQTQRRLVKMLMALSDGRAEETAREAIAIGRPFKKTGFDEEEFRERVGQLVTDNLGKPLAQLHTGQIVMQINAAAGETGLKLPSAIVMLGKTLMNLDKVVDALDPEFDPNEALRRHTGGIVARRQTLRMTAGRLYETLMESAEFVELMPERLNKIAELISENKLKLDVDAIDEHRLMAGFQKVANRITTGLILAALIVGASLMLRMDVEPRLFGYPAIAMVFFLTAAIASLVLLWHIAFHDDAPEE